MSIHVCELWFGWDPLALPMVNGMSNLVVMRFAFGDIDWQLWASHHSYGLPETPLALAMVKDMPNLGCVSIGCDA
jgi:hypothetical protein